MKARGATTGCLDRSGINVIVWGVTCTSRPAITLPGRGTTTCEPSGFMTIAVLRSNSTAEVGAFGSTSRISPGTVGRREVVMRMRVPEAIDTSCPAA
jgi:hypothetical protein